MNNQLKWPIYQDRARFAYEPAIVWPGPGCKRGARVLSLRRRSMLLLLLLVLPSLLPPLPSLLLYKQVAISSSSHIMTAVCPSGSSLSRKRYWAPSGEFVRARVSVCGQTSDGFGQKKNGVQTAPTAVCIISQLSR
jgi:hypothetical protein